MTITAVLLSFLALSPLLVTCEKDANEQNLVNNLPGAPLHAFRQYAGYITVDEEHGKALFYWLVEARENAANKPLTLWLNGGPGCSSIGGGALSELGPFYPNAAGDGLIPNENSWNRESNILFLESPVGVGFSYSNTTSDYEIGDAQTAEDAHKFVLLWLRRYPQYQGRDFYLAGESYAGHYVPQLAQRIWRHRATDSPAINFKGFAVGNAWTDPKNDNKGTVDFWWDRAMISDDTFDALHLHCNFEEDFDQHEDYSLCYNTTLSALAEMGNINIYAVYKDMCVESPQAAEALRFLKHRGVHNKRAAAARVGAGKAVYEPCIDNQVQTYLNTRAVQRALHANTTGLPGIWLDCSEVVQYSKVDDNQSMLPIYRELVDTPLRIWVYSGDVDGIVPVTGTRNWLHELQKEKTLNLTSRWAPWYSGTQVGGHSEVYNDGKFVFVSVRNAGHMVPYTEPGRALILFRSFINDLAMPAAAATAETFGESNVGPLVASM